MQKSTRRKTTPSSLALEEINLERRVRDRDPPTVVADPEEIGAGRPLGRDDLGNFRQESSWRSGSQQPSLTKRESAKTAEQVWRARLGTSANNSNRSKRQHWVEGA